MARLKTENKGKRKIKSKVKKKTIFKSVNSIKNITKKEVRYQYKRYKRSPHKRKVKSKLYKKIKFRHPYSDKNFALKVLPLVSILFIIGLGLLIGKRSLTGFVVINGEAKYYVDNFNTAVNESTKILWQPKENLELVSFKISGYTAPQGRVKIYLENGYQRYLVYDSKQPSATSNIITGQVVHDIVQDIDGIKEKKVPQDAKIHLAMEELVSISDSSKKVFDVSKSNFSWLVNENFLCTKWKVLSEDSLRSKEICNGNTECCNAIGVVQEYSEWKDPFIVKFNAYSATASNLVYVQVFYFNNDQFDFIYSNVESQRADFERNNFYDSCEDTCSLPALKGTSYNLSFDIDDSFVYINKIIYELIKKEENTSPILIKNISTQDVFKNNVLTINLSEYFIDQDGDILNYTYFKSNEISVTFYGELAVFNFSRDFMGVISTFFIADDGKAKEVSNVFIINVTSDVGIPILQQPIKVGNNVKWKKRVNVEAPEILINITASAVNISIKKIDFDGRNVTINASQVFIAVKDKTEELELFELRREKEKAEKRAEFERVNEIREIIKKKEEELGYKEIPTLERAVGKYSSEFEILENATLILKNIETEFEEIQVDYETDAPEAIETEVQEFSKKIIISSDIPYTNVIAYTKLQIEVPKEAIKVYWLTDSGKTEITEISYYDNNSNNLTDYIEWIVPHLSNQTFEINITVLNVQSYPMVGGNWTVAFNTTGTGNLTILGYDGTTYTEFFIDDNNTINDLIPLELRCGDEIIWSKDSQSARLYVYFILINGSKVRLVDAISDSWQLYGIFIENYSCNNLISYHTVNVLTPGIHNQRFNFSNQIADAHNLASIAGNRSVQDQFIDKNQTDFDKGTYNNTISSVVNLTLTRNNSQITNVPNSSQFSPNESTVMFLQFNEVEGNATDSSQYGHNGTLTAIRDSISKFGSYAVLLDGTTYVSVNNTNILGPERITIEFWMRPALNYSSANSTLVHKQNDYQVYLDEGKLVFIHNDDRVNTTSRTWNSAEWYYISAVSQPEKLDLYINGVRAETIGRFDFYIQNSTSSNVAKFSNTGDLVLKGTCSTTCVSPGDSSFIMLDNTDTIVAYIDGSGNLCITDNNCNDKDASCTPQNNSFIVENSQSISVATINSSGALCLTGSLTQNGVP